MKKMIFCILLPFFCAAASAQQPESRIALTPYVEYSLERVPETAARALERKLLSMTTANGFASVSGEFFITAVPDVLGTAVTATAPAQYVSDVEVAVYVLNNPEQVIVGQKVYSLKGVGASEQKAVINAISQIDVRSVDIRRFLDNMRTKMLDYYADRLPALIAKAQSLAASTKYEEALAVLAPVPESLVEYPQVAELMVDIYTMCIDRDARKIIALAKGKIASGDSSAALRELVKVDPNSTLFKEADAMVSNIAQALTAERQAELEKELKQYEQEKARAEKEYEDAVALEKLKIEASKEIASGASKVSSGSKKPEKTLAEWFFGNLL